MFDLYRTEIKVILKLIKGMECPKAEFIKVSTKCFESVWFIYFGISSHVREGLIEAQHMKPIMGKHSEDCTEKQHWRARKPMVLHVVLHCSTVNAVFSHILNARWHQTITNVDLSSVKSSSDIQLGATHHSQQSLNLN